MEFKTKLKRYVDCIQEELAMYIRKEACPEEILNQAVAYSLLAGGKRIRPVLILATYELFKPDSSCCLPYAVAMEMVHNFSLIHDDLPGIDNDDLRHGKLTNHKKYNEATAILAGDSLLNQAYMVLTKDILEEKEEGIKNNKLVILAEFSNAIDRMIAGEYIDTEYEGKQILDDYLEYMHRNKTGALLIQSVRIGARLADCSMDELTSLTQYAAQIGLAFQIKDDILSEIGNEQILGKPIGNDRKKGKCTYVTKYGLETAQMMLEDITQKAISYVERFGEKGEFLKDLSLFIRDREK